MKKTLLQLLGVYLFCSTSFSQVGQLDASFGNAGVSAAGVTGYWDEAFALALQQDGKIIAAGRYSDNNSFNAGLIARLNADGSPDASFGTTGKVSFEIGNQENVMALAVQPDGKILAAGYYIGTDGHYAVLRFNPDGSLDNTFGSGGIDTFSFFEGMARSMVVQTDGKILLGGTDYTGNSSSHIMRLNTDGSVDSTFGINGRMRYQLGPADSDIFKLILQTDGKIIACGYVRQSNDYRMSVARINVAGTIDSAFGTNGLAVADSGNSFGYAVALQADGKILAVGEGSNGVNDDALIMRWNADGSLDNSFGVNGRLQFPVSTQEDEIRGVAVDTSGKILVGGTTRIPTNYMNAFVARLNSDGSFDNSFGTSGIAISSLNGVYGAEIWAAAIQPDNKFLVAGNFYNTASASRDFAIARFRTVCSTIDTSVSITTTSLTAVQPNGTYQWFNCDSNSIVAGATNALFMPPSEGSYAVAIVVDGCADTSACVSLQGVGISEKEHITMSASPNPFHSFLQISVTETEEDAMLELIDLTGRLVARAPVTHQKKLLDTSLVNTGVYLLRIVSSKNTWSQLVVKE